MRRRLSNFIPLLRPCALFTRSLPAPNRVTQSVFTRRLPFFSTLYSVIPHSLTASSRFRSGGIAHPVSLHSKF